MKQILVTGSEGQVGRAIQEISSEWSFRFLFTHRRNLDITDAKRIQEYFEEHRIDFVINCAAYTKVDVAEEEQDQARLINTDAVRSLSQACAKANIPFIHISSDYVYHPDHDQIMDEDEKTNPQGVYAQTKLDGDLEALRNNPKTIILRTSWVYAKKGKNFVNTIARLVDEKEQLSIVHDQIGSPSYAPDIAQAILKMVRTIDQHQVQEQYHGIYHFSNEGFISWYQFAQEIVRLKGSTCQLNPCTTEDYPTPAKRPLNSRLSKSKIQKTFNIELRPWKERLEKCLTD